MNQSSIPALVPTALSRLAYETGGIYFTVHPNRRLGQRVRGNEIEPFASKLEYFLIRR